LRTLVYRSIDHSSRQQRLVTTPLASKLASSPTPLAMLLLLRFLRQDHFSYYIHCALVRSSYANPFSATFRLALMQMRRFHQAHHQRH
jgi:hypothetical protein